MTRPSASGCSPLASNCLAQSNTTTGWLAVIPHLVHAHIPTFRDTDANMTAALCPGSVLAINLGKNKTLAMESSEDFVTGVKTFSPYANVLVVNVLSPNTPGLRCVHCISYFCLGLLMSETYDRGLQNRELLESLLVDVTKARDKLEPSPIMSHQPHLVLKVAPDLQES